MVRTTIGMNMLKNIRLLIALSSLVLITACGGGGGGGATDSGTYSCLGNQTASNYNITGNTTTAFTCVRASSSPTPVVDNTGKCCKSYTYSPSTKTYTPHYVQIGKEPPNGGVVCDNANADYACQ